ncbi:hypothetical protein CK203_027318 [Vitis vinifera]|uniref:Uncharacterized protein n=1 Tax=Vitis vinifera TaxID=29760 RepID=A0A438J9G6_VITVI|nr:hypothetical protein CK203_027318 [Vitis vinifera]
MCPNTSKRLLRVCRSLVVCYQIWSHTSFSYGTVVVLWHSYRQEISWKRFYLSVMQDSWRELANAFANGRTLFSLHSTHQRSLAQTLVLSASGMRNPEASISEYVRDLTSHMTAYLVEMSNKNDLKNFSQQPDIILSVSCLLERLRGAARALEPRTQKAIYEMGFSVMNSVLVLLEVYKHEFSSSNHPGQWFETCGTDVIFKGTADYGKQKLWSSVACAVGTFLEALGGKFMFQLGCFLLSVHWEEHDLIDHSHLFYAGSLSGFLKFRFGIVRRRKGVLWATTSNGFVKLNFDGCLDNPVQGLEGCLGISLWHNESGGYSISVRFRNCASGFSWIFSEVYEPVIGCEKEDFWEELGVIRGLWEDPWCIGGDFNAVRFPVEKRNALRLTVEMRRFSEIGPLLDFRPMEDHFSDIMQSALPRLVSKDLVRSWWNGYSVEGNSNHCIAEKLKALKKDLKNWNKEVVGNVSFNRAEAFSRLQCWKAKENENSLLLEKRRLKKLALKDYKKWALLEETSWRQKSREIWLRKGDKNTRYFHKMANEGKEKLPV